MSWGGDWRTTVNSDLCIHLPVRPRDQTWSLGLCDKCLYLWSHPYAAFLVLWVMTVRIQPDRILTWNGFRQRNKSSPRALEEAYTQRTASAGAQDSLPGCFSCLHLLEADAFSDNQCLGARWPWSSCTQNCKVMPKMHFKQMSGVSLCKLAQATDHRGDSLCYSDGHWPSGSLYATVMDSFWLA